MNDIDGIGEHARKMVAKSMVQNAENELICEKLLRWSSSDIATAKDLYEMPPFATWAEAGLILDALKILGERPKVLYSTGRECWCCQWDLSSCMYHTAQTGPLAVRAAALSYIREKSSARV